MSMYRKQTIHFITFTHFHHLCENRDTFHQSPAHNLIIIFFYQLQGSAGSKSSRKVEVSDWGRGEVCDGCRFEDVTQLDVSHKIALWIEVVITVVFFSPSSTLRFEDLVPVLYQEGRYQGDPVTLGIGGFGRVELVRVCLCFVYYYVKNKSNVNYIVFYDKLLFCVWGRGVIPSMFIYMPRVCYGWLLVSTSARY